MLSDVNLLRLTIKQVAAKLRNGQLTASELCEQCIQQATKLQELNMFITTTSVEARDAAMKADKRLKIGQPLSLVDGVPFAVKDNFSTTGIRTTCASRMLHNYVPPYDATVVERLCRAGGALMGKTNLDEFAMGSGSVDGAFGAVRNPWQYRLRKKAAGKMPLEEQQQQLLAASATGSQTGTASSVQSIASAEEDCDDWFIAGGSSGGSAVAVATGAAFIALGSDTGGSTRNPAAYCGVVGLKPTYGLVSRHGLIPLVNSMDVPGVLTRCVDDAVIALNLLAGHCERDSTTVTDPYEPFEISDSVSVTGLTVGIPIEYHAPGTSAEVVGAWERVARLLETGGATVRQVSLPHTQHSIVCYSVLCASEVASNMARYDGIEYGLRADDESSTEALYAASRRAGFNDVVRGRILAGNYFALKRNYDDYLVKAQKLRRLIAEDFKAVYASGVDVLLTPAVLGDAPAYSFFSKADNRTRTSEQDVFTQPANMAGIPALVLPVQTSKRGLPIGLQLLGPSFSERRLLEVAKWIEQRVEFPSLNLNAL